MPRAAGIPSLLIFSSLGVGYFFFLAFLVFDFVFILVFFLVVCFIMLICIYFGLYFVL